MHKKNLLKYYLPFTLLFMSLPAAQAYEMWHTASGNAYEIHEVRKKIKTVTIKSASKAFVHQWTIVYRTSLALHRSRSLRKEFYDILTHFYYFRRLIHFIGTPESRITVVAFNTSGNPFQKKSVRTKRLSFKYTDLTKIVSSHKQIDPHRLDAYHHFHSGKFKPALQSFEEIQDKTAYDYSLMGRGHLFLNKHKESTDILNKGVSIYPKNIDLLNDLAMTIMSEGTFRYQGADIYDLKNMRRAEQLLVDAENLNPNMWLTKAHLALVKSRLYHHQEAEALFKEARRLNKSSSTLYYMMGKFYQERHQMAKSARLYRRALKILDGRRDIAAQQEKKIINSALAHLTSK